MLVDGRIGPPRRPDLDGIAAYSSVRPGPTPIRVRASSNEAAGPVPAELLEAALAPIRDAHRYPPLLGADLADAIADRHEVASGCVAVGDGSLAVLDRLLLAFVGPGEKVVMGWRSYEGYPLSARIAGARLVQVPLTTNGVHDLPAMAAAVDAHTRVVIVCNPNNPTGTVVAWSQLLEFLDGLPSSVLAVLDEAYVDYADVVDRPAGGVPAELAARPNVAVLRTFSKAHGLAGLRVGYLVADPMISAAVRSVSTPFPVSAPAIAAAICSLEHPDWVRDRVLATRRERDAVRALLTAHGYPVLPSQANFVWTALGAAALDFAEFAAAHGVLVRPFADEGVRITVGDPLLRPALEPVLARWQCPR